MCFRRAIIEKTRDSDAGLLLWAVEPEESLDSIAERLELVISPLKRSLPDGGHCSFRLAGLQQVGFIGPAVDWETLLHSHLLVCNSKPTCGDSGSSLQKD